MAVSFARFISYTAVVNYSLDDATGSEYLHPCVQNLIWKQPSLSNYPIGTYVLLLMALQTCCALPK